MLLPGPKLQPEVKPQVVNPSAHGGGWCSWAAGVCTAAVCSRQAGQGAFHGHRACCAHGHPPRCPSGVIWRYALALIGVIKQKLCRSLSCVEWEFLCSVCVQ